MKNPRVYSPASKKPIVLKSSGLALLNNKDKEEKEYQLEETQKATFNILEDFYEEKLRLEDTQRAILNILDDLNQSNEELQKAHNILETRVAERTADLARSNAELEQFAYIASHDLQEPLRMVSSYVQLLSKRYKGKLDEDADDFIGFAYEGALRMQTLINDLLSYSRAGRHDTRYEKVKLAKAMEKAIENLQLIIKEKKAVITFDTLPLVFGDMSQLTQVFQNLIENAIKFRREDPPAVHISARLERNECICSIKDNGIGIDPEYQGKLFLLFQRLHTRKEYPGTGLGLAICKRIIEKHRGKIWVKSKPDKGSIFYFKIPIKPKESLQ